MCAAKLDAREPISTKIGVLWAARKYTLPAPPTREEMEVLSFQQTGAAVPARWPHDAAGACDACGAPNAEALGLCRRCQR